MQSENRQEVYIPTENTEKAKNTEFLPVITDSGNAASVLEENGISYEGEIELKKIGFCKIEAQQDCLTGSFCIPKLLDVQGSRYRILFFITKDKIVLVDDDEFSRRLISRISHKKSSRCKTKENFLFSYIADFINRDLENLIQFEKRLMELEESIHSGHTDNFQSSIMSIRRDLLILRGYYDEIMDLGKALEENENGYFAKKQLKYFGTISDRAEQQHAVYDHYFHRVFPPHADHRMVWHEFPEYAGAGKRVSGSDPAQYSCHHSLSAHFQNKKDFLKAGETNAGIDIRSGKNYTMFEIRRQFRQRRSGHGVL